MNTPMNKEFNFNTADILDFLRKGASQEEIAKAFAESLNRASATYKQEKSVENQKLKDAEAVAYFYNTYYPELFNEKDNSLLNARDLIEVADTLTKFSVKTATGAPADAFLRLFSL